MARHSVACPVRALPEGEEMTQKIIVTRPYDFDSGKRIKKQKVLPHDWYVSDTERESWSPNESIKVDKFRETKRL